MQLTKQTILEIAEAVVNILEQRNLVVGKSSKQEKLPISKKSAYAKTEALLYNYNGFKKIVRDKQQEIVDIRTYGVPEQCGSVGERVQTSLVHPNIVLPEETVEAAVQRIVDSMEGTVQAIAMIDKCMAVLQADPYYKILEMRYFEGRTQEDIAATFNCDQATISRNKNRLVRELSMQMFPGQVVEEMLM